MRGRCPVCGALVRLRLPTYHLDAPEVVRAGLPVCHSHRPGEDRAPKPTARRPSFQCMGAGAAPDGNPVEPA